LGVKGLTFLQNGVVDMLVLSRKVEEKILVGDNVTITIVRIGGDTVRIGIEAPPEIIVLRAELKKKEEEEEKELEAEGTREGGGD